MTDIVERLRGWNACAFDLDGPEWTQNELTALWADVTQAADALEAKDAEIERLREQEKYLRLSLKDAERLLQQRAKTVMEWAKRAIRAEDHKGEVR